MWLALDTATERASVALGHTAAGALEQQLVGARQHARALVPMIADLLDRAGIGLAQLQGIVIADGPGSFTGLRVGASVAKALVRARGLELWTAPSLMTRARAVAEDDGASVLAIANALRGELYAAVYRFTPGRVATVLAPSVYRPETLMAHVSQPATVVGDAPADVLDQLAKWADRTVVTSPAGAARAALLLDLRQREGGARRIEAPAAWEPEYGRPAEAQARWEQTHGRPLPDPAGTPR